MNILYDKTYPWLPSILYKLDPNIPPGKEAIEFDLKENYRNPPNKEDVEDRIKKIIKKKLALESEFPMKIESKM